MAKTISPKEEFIVCWEEDGDDPIKTFATIGKAKEFIVKELIKNENGNYDDVEKESIKLYKGTLIGKAKVDVSFK